MFSDNRNEESVLDSEYPRMGRQRPVTAPTEENASASHKIEGQKGGLYLTSHKSSTTPIEIHCYPK